MKTVAKVSWLHEADSIRMRLQSHGIAAYVPDEGIASMNPIIGNAVGGIRIQVSDEDEAAAREILGETAEPMAVGDLICPVCQSGDVSYERWSRKVFFVGILLVGIPFIWMKRSCRCRACGAQWKPS